MSNSSSHYVVRILFILSITYKLEHTKQARAKTKSQLSTKKNIYQQNLHLSKNNITFAA